MSARVVLKGHSGAMYKEADALSAITPGHLIMLDAATQKAKVQTATALVEARVAIENHWTGGDLNTPYAANDRVLFQVLGEGAEFNALVAPAAPAIAFGDYLESAGDGTVRKTVTQANAFAIARLAVDNSAGGSAVRIRAEIRL